MDVSVPVAMINMVLAAVAAVAVASMLADVVVAIYEWLRSSVIGREGWRWHDNNSEWY